MTKTRLERLICGSACFLLAVTPTWADDREQNLQEQIDVLKTQYEERIRVLEERVEELETQQRNTSNNEAENELSALRNAAAAAGSSTEIQIRTPEIASTGRERNLSSLNPEISFTGDVVAFNQSGTQDFEAREFELDLQATLDPFSSTKWTLAFSEEEGVEIEEGYIRYTGLSPGLELRAGKMRQSFGALNRTHLHALPQVSYPLVLTSFFDEEGLVQTGVSANWLLPTGWAHANEVTLQLMDSSSEPFNGEDLEDLTLLGHLKNFWDLSPATYLEWGLSGIVGQSSDTGNSRIWGTDLTVHWQPAARAKYRELTWRTEILVSQRENAFEVEQEAVGGYTYFEGLLRRNLYAGVRYDRLEDPLDPASKAWAIEPYLAWWQSEYVRLRLAYQSLQEGSRDRRDDRFTLQLTWAAGPHKHESY